MKLKFYKEYGVEAVCDSCDSAAWFSASTRDKVVAAMRKAGWKIGKRVTCPNCVDKRRA